MGMSVEDRLGAAPRRCGEVIRHAVRRGAAAALAATSIRSDEDLHNMAIGFALGEDPGETSVLASSFRVVAGAIAEAEDIEDIIRSAPQEG